MPVHESRRRQGRSDRRFHPGSWGHGLELQPGLELEPRVLLSARAAAAATMSARHAHTSRVPPATEINAQYDAFVLKFAAVENLYVTAINEQSSGTVSVTATGQTSAAGIFRSFISNRTNQMAINLVQYFNGLPLKLPKFNAPPHTPTSRGAIQNYVYDTVAGSTTSLQQSLLAIPLPTTASDQQIYDEAVTAAIAHSRKQTLNGVSQVYAGRLLVSVPAPNNRYGVLATQTIPANILA